MHTTLEQRNYVPFGEDLAATDSTGGQITVRTAVTLILALVAIFFVGFLLVKFRSTMRHKAQPARAAAENAPVQSSSGAYSNLRYGSTRHSRRPAHPVAANNELHRTSSWHFATARHDEVLPQYRPRAHGDTPSAQAQPRAETTQGPRPPPYVPIIELAPMPPAYFPGETHHGPAL